MQVHIKIFGPKFLFNNLTEAITKLVSVRKRYQFALYSRITIHCSTNTRKNLYLFLTMFLTVFHSFSPFYAQERIAPIALRSVALYKRATGAICFFQRKNRYFALSLTKSERFARKPKELIPNPAEPFAAGKEATILKTSGFC